MYHIIAEKIKATEKRKPKVYYQFWAAHVVMIGLLIHTLIRINITPIIYVALGFSFIMNILYYRSTLLEVRFDTPTQFCICHQAIKIGCSIIMAIGSLYLITISIYLCITALPTVIFIYYLYPARTLIRLPFIINSILYINSLLALLLFQIERLCFVFTKSCSAKLRCKNKFCVKNEDEEFYDEYYKKVAVTGSKRERSGSFIRYLVEPTVTSFILAMLVQFITILSDLFILQNHFTVRDQVDTLILLVPTLLLLFGSWYKLDVFFDIKEQRSEKEILREILEEMKLQKRADTEVESQTNTANVEARLTDIEMETLANESDAETQPADTETDIPLANQSDIETEPAEMKTLTHKSDVETQPTDIEVETLTNQSAKETQSAVDIDQDTTDTHHDENESLRSNPPAANCPINTNTHQ